ncbi:MAG: HAD family phosphatase [Dehalococcoidia bacterium]|nr:HAD family phosphatase [Dehalococcoidia bacterium]
MGAPVRAVFFDFGGVVAALDRDHMRALEREYGLPERGLWRAMYETPEWQALRIGTGSETAWVGAIRRTLDELAGHPVADAISQRWVECWRGLDQDILALIAGLRGRYRVGMISNATLTLEDELRDHHKIHDQFETIVNSARVGFAKPDARIFQHAAQAMGLAPGACLHIDDLPHNVAGARAAGFQAALYDGDFPALERELRAAGVQW